jgi:heme ABC exporter ATP-binding subunit CcmA
LKVQVANLSKAYKFFWALKDIHLELRGGECVALLGPNGAGKTTLLRLLSALTRPTRGAIEIDGAALTRPGRRRPAIGYLSPGEHLYEGLTARENLRLFLSLYSRKKEEEEMTAALEQVGLSRWADNFVSSLSAGMKSRLLLAKWTLVGSRLLLLDEPYGALDGSGVDLLDGYVASLCRQGGIVVIATHHIPRALNLCTRAIILHQGKLIFDEPRQDPWEHFHRAMGEFLPRGERWRS